VGGVRGRSRRGIKGESLQILLPKTNLVKHYMHKYHMVHKGRQLCLEKEALDYILKKYFYV
jgi:hypothetical protein